MPELPEVEAVCRKLRTHVEGLRVVRMHVERAGIVRPQRPHALESKQAHAAKALGVGVGAPVKLKIG